MNFGNLGSPRTGPTDRAGVSVGKANRQSAIAPAAETVRWTYTVPSGKQAAVLAGQSQAVRITAGAPVGYWYAALRYNDGTTTVYYCQAASFGNAAGDAARASVGQGAVALPGAVLDAVTADGSTGGTVTFENHAVIIEYAS